MFHKKNILILILVSCSCIAFFSFQNEDSNNLSNEKAIELALQEKINHLEFKYAQNCEKRVMDTAIPIADSLIAEMYARDLRAQDSILVRPERPEMPQVEINPFPFDSIE